uniref:Uncharacterized protein n=1 Tax=Arundo donax TaxID=35708 RepID=A0A0A8ZI34_ARUDO
MQSLGHSSSCCSSFSHYQP